MEPANFNTINNQIEQETELVQATRSRLKRVNRGELTGPDQKRRQVEVAPCYLFNVPGELQVLITNYAGPRSLKSLFDTSTYGNGGLKNLIFTLDPSWLVNKLVRHVNGK